MSVFATCKTMHKAYLILGSNMDPAANLHQGLEILREYVIVQEVSTPWETQAVDGTGPNFLNSAVCILTSMDADMLKWQVLRKIEADLGRVRSEDKNAPRPLDLDIILFDGQVLDPKLWDHFFVAIPMAELLPEMINPLNGKKLYEIAQKIREQTVAIPHPELSELIR